MKFTDGQWLLREGVTAAYPSAAHDVDVTDQRLAGPGPDLPGARPRRPAQGAGPHPGPRVADDRRDRRDAHPLRRRAAPQAGVRPRHRRARGRTCGSTTRWPRSPAVGCAHACIADRTGGVELRRRRAAAHRQRREGHGAADDRRRRAPRARAARARRRRHRLRPRGAVRPAGPQRPDRRHLERRRRHEQRAGLQERPVLPHQRRLRRLRRHPGQGLLRGRLGAGLQGAVQRRRGSRCATWSSTARRPRRSCASTPR